MGYASIVSGVGMGKYFGTDGIRGRVGGEVMFAPWMLGFGQALGRFLGANRRVIIGKDTRLSGYMLESALEAGLAASGVHCHLVGPVPTPVLAFLTKSLGLDLGVMITASHNPYTDNGIKLMNHAGEKLSLAEEAAIEQEIDHFQWGACDNAALGRASRVHDVFLHYHEHARSFLHRADFSLSGWRIVVDAAQGAFYRLAPQILEAFGAEVIPLHCEPDGLNINRDCGTLHPQVAIHAVLEKQADIGIVFDGDGDRVHLIDSKGRLYDGDELLYILALARKQSNHLRGGVVGTIISNLGLAQALSRHDIPFHRAPVGDRFVIEALKKLGWQLGGERSGHLIVHEGMPCGDGLIAALSILECLDGLPLSGWLSDFQKVPQMSKNLICEGTPEALLSLSQTQDCITRAQKALGNGARLVVRGSGTEPLLRLLIEGEDITRNEEILEALAQDLQAVVSSVI